MTSNNPDSTEIQYDNNGDEVTNNNDCLILLDDIKKLIQLSIKKTKKKELDAIYSKLDILTKSIRTDSLLTSTHTDQEKKLKMEADLSNRKRPEFFLQEEQRRAIKEALNNQTYVQFKSYAEQQYPNDLEQQNILITKLQEQHYEQYMQQIVQQRLINERMNGQSSSTLSQTLESPLSKNPENANHHPQQSTTGYSNELLSTSSSSTAGLSSPSSSSGFYSTDSPITPTVNRTINLSQIAFQEVIGDKSSPRIYKIDENIDEGVGQELKSPGHLDQGSHHYMTTDSSHSVTRSGGSETIARIKNEGDNEDESDSDIDEESCPEDFRSVENPRMWTTKDIVGFKQSIRQINGDGIIKVGHGEIVTVRVPTHPEGSCIFWEFATDSYDIGFGLFFEWTKNPGTQVSVHISESEDEEEEDEIIGPNTGGNGLPTDPEKGSHSSKCISSDELPSAVIVPIYRRDCHEEVYAGSHPYPGKGAYLLKFDNSYSLWRSKTLYYRVYYTK